MQGKVYIVQEVLRRGQNNQLERAMDLNPASVYGELVVLLTSNKSPLVAAPIIRELRQKLATFSDNDYLLAVGAPTFIGWTTAIAADVNGGRVKMLIWDRETRSYIVVPASLWGRTQEAA